MGDHLDGFLMEATQFLAQVTGPVVNFLEAARDLVDAVAAAVDRAEQEHKERDSSSA